MTKCMNGQNCEWGQATKKKWRGRDKEERNRKEKQRKKNEREREDKQKQKIAEMPNNTKQQQKRMNIKEEEEEEEEEEESEEKEERWIQPKLKERQRWRKTRRGRRMQERWGRDNTAERNESKQKDSYVKFIRMKLIGSRRRKRERSLMRVKRTPHHHQQQEKGRKESKRGQSTDSRFEEVCKVGGGADGWRWWITQPEEKKWKTLLHHRHQQQQHMHLFVFVSALWLLVLVLARHRHDWLGPERKQESKKAGKKTKDERRRQIGKKGD